MRALAVVRPRLVLLGAAGCEDVRDAGLTAVAAELGDGMLALDVLDCQWIGDAGLG